MKSDGTVAFCGDNLVGQCDIPELDQGLAYTQVSAGGGHSLLLRSNGTVTVCGGNWHGQCNIPEFDEGLAYTQVSAGSQHSLLLKSNGTVAACGANNYGQCNIPELEEGSTYAECTMFKLKTSDVLQLSYKTDSAGQLLLVFSSLAGIEKCVLAAADFESVGAVERQIADELDTQMAFLDVILQDGRRMKGLDPSMLLVNVVAADCKIGGYSW